MTALTLALVALVVCSHLVGERGFVREFRGNSVQEHSEDSAHRCHHNRAGRCVNLNRRAALLAEPVAGGGAAGVVSGPTFDAESEAFYCNAGPDDGSPRHARNSGAAGPYASRSQSGEVVERDEVAGNVDALLQRGTVIRVAVQRDAAESYVEIEMRPFRHVGHPTIPKSVCGTPRSGTRLEPAGPARTTGGARARLRRGSDGIARARYLATQTGSGCQAFCSNLPPRRSQRCDSVKPKAIMVATATLASSNGIQVFMGEHSIRPEWAVK